MRRGLTTVAAVKRELGITGSADHDFLEDLILQASVSIEGWCGRTFSRETSPKRSGSRPKGPCCIWPAGQTSPSRRLSKMAWTLAADDWELDAATGELWRLNRRRPPRRMAGGQDRRRLCRRRYPLPGDPQRDLPEDLERACLGNGQGPLFARLIPWSRASRSRASPYRTTGCHPPAPAIPACRQSRLVCSSAIASSLSEDHRHA